MGEEQAVETWMIVAIAMPAATSIACALFLQKRLGRRIAFLVCGLIGAYVAFGIAIGVLTVIGYLAIQAGALSFARIWITHSPVVFLTWVPSLLIFLVSRRFREQDLGNSVAKSAP